MGMETVDDVFAWVIAAFSHSTKVHQRRDRHAVHITHPHLGVISLDIRYERVEPTPENGLEGKIRFFSVLLRFDRYDATLVLRVPAGPVSSAFPSLM